MTHASKPFYYRLSHSDSVDYDEEPALEHTEDLFRLRVADGEAVFEMRGQLADVESARNQVDLCVPINGDG